MTTMYELTMSNGSGAKAGSVHKSIAGVIDKINTWQLGGMEAEVYETRGGFGAAPKLVAAGKAQTVRNTLIGMERTSK